MTSTVAYMGNLRTVAVHLSSNNEIITDAPKDNHGQGEAFSPTDLIATSLASCMITIMGIKANDLGIDLTNTHATITKHMGTSPRRISKIELVIYMNQDFGHEINTKLERAGLACPVAQSLHVNLEQDIEFIYP